MQTGRTLSTNTLMNSDGKPNIIGWVLFIGTLALIIYSCVQSHYAIKQMAKDEASQKDKMAEFELNLRRVMEKEGLTYEKIS